MIITNIYLMINKVLKIIKLLNHQQNIKIDLRSQIIFIESKSDLIDTLLIKSSSIKLPSSKHCKTLKLSAGNSDRKVYNRNRHT